MELLEDLVGLDVSKLDTRELELLRDKCRNVAGVLKSHARSARTALQFVSELASELDRIAEGGHSEHEHSRDTRI